MKRIFIGIPLSVELKEVVWEWQNKFQITNFKNQNPNDQIRFISGKNLHVTLVPPWESGKGEGERVKLEAINFQPFEIRFSKIEFGPDPRQPRLIWMTGHPNEEIKKLKKLTEIAVGQPLEKRDFKLHATVARLRAGFSGQLRSELAAGYNHLGRFAATPPYKGGEAPQLPQVIDWSQIVDRFMLYESHLSPAGAEYEALQTFYLQ